MFCPRCGTALADGAYFCPKCGAENSPGATPAAGTAGTPGTPVQPPQTSGLAVASLVTSLLPFFIVTPIVAVILGHVSLSQIKRSAGRLKGSGLAIAGLVIGYCSFLPLLLIFAAILIPNLLRARIAANESSAMASVRTLATAELTYSTEHPERGFTCSLDDLKNDHIIGAPLADGHNSSYVFELVGCKAENPDGPNTQFQIIAYPITKSKTGVRAFCTDQTDVVRYVRDGSGEDCLDHGKNVGEYE